MAITQQTDFAALRAVTGYAVGDIAFVAKRNTSDTTTDGGGTFVYDSASSATDNDATVIQPANIPSGPGRWLRRMDARGPFHAEWFGAKSDGINDDSAAIQSCLNEFNSVTLLARTYTLIASDAGLPTKVIITVKDDSRVQGQGIDKTVIKVAYVNALGTANQIYAFGPPAVGFSHRAVIRDLTIDCGFGLSSDVSPPPSKNSTRHAIYLLGDNTTVERVKAMNFGVGELSPGSRIECFVITVKSATPSGGTIGTIKDCIITQPGNSFGIYTEPNPIIPEITCLLITGFIDFSNFPSSYNVDDIGYGGRVVGNRIYDMKYDATTQRCPLHGITYGQCMGTEIADNEVLNFDGAAVYVDSFRDEALVIRNNRFINVNIGVSINANAPGQFPWHLGTQICENVILLGKYQNLTPGIVPYGVLLYVSDAALINPPAKACIADITIERNFIRSLTPDLPFGLLINAGNADNFNAAPARIGIQRVKVTDNILQVPDPETNPWYKISGVYLTPTTSESPGGEPYENAMVVMTKELYLKSLDLIQMHGNRSLGSMGTTGPDERLKFRAYDGGTPPGGVGAYNSRSAWGAFSTLLARFQSPMFDGRAGLLYDDFVGNIPSSGSGLASALRWAGAVSSGGVIVAEDNDSTTPGPGIVRLETGTSASGAATLRYAASSVIFNSNSGLGNRMHVIECAVKRSDSANSTENYECLFGFLNDSDQGIYFRINNGSLNAFQANTTNASGTFPMSPILLKSITNADIDFTFDTSPPSWTTLRIEVLRYPTGVYTARFFVNGKYSGKINNTGTMCFPLDLGLYCGFRIKKLAGTTSRKMWVDYFQHQIVPAS